VAATPKVSIGMPVFNAERFVGRAIRSILEQTYADLELIVSDNASTDRTREICEEMARQDPRMRLVTNPSNIGAAANFNQVLTLSRGTYFKWACGDDWCAPMMVERCVAVLDANPDVVACFGRVQIVDEQGNPVRLHSDELDLRTPDVRTRLRLAIGHGGLLHVLQGLMRADVLKRIGHMLAFYTSDVVLMAELALWGKFHEVDEPLLFRRMHPGAANAMTSSAERLAHLDPRRNARFHMVRSRRLWEHARSVGRCPEGPVMKLRLWEVVLKSAYWARSDLVAEVAQAFGGIKRGRRA
jgi:glycosyltransferase involved in cell wall biosynthesis